MNQMFDIYNNYADLYDELVNHEDYKNNLRTFLNDNGEVLPYFYEKLEQYGFKKNIIETDYKFYDYKEASRIMGAFFGDNMKNNILSNKSNIIKEYTGIWNRTIALTGRCFIFYAKTAPILRQTS